MGKGGTKFVGEAVGVRGGSGQSNDSGKKRRKNMEKFLETGVHPEVEQAKRQKMEDAQIVGLPDPDPHRAHIFLELRVGNQRLEANGGRIVVELFDDLVPVAANHFKNRCLPGSSAGLQGAYFHRLLPHYAIFGGKSPAAMAAVALQRSPLLRNTAPGTVGVSHDGTEFCISLEKSLVLDATFQVVGRIHMGQELVDELNEMPTTPDDAPVTSIHIARCGVTTSKGNLETLDPTAQETDKQSHLRLKELAADTGRAIKEAYRAGIVNTKSQQEVRVTPSKTVSAKTKALNQSLGISDESGSDSEEET